MQRSKTRINADMTSGRAARIPTSSAGGDRTYAPGIMGFVLVAGEIDGKRTLVMRDAQHAYVFQEK